MVLSLGLARLYSAKTSLNTITIGGVPAGRTIAADKLEPKLQQKADKYQLKIGHPQAEPKSFPLKEAGLNIDTAASVRQAKQRQQTAPFIHRIQFWLRIVVIFFLEVSKSLSVTFCFISLATI